MTSLGVPGLPFPLGPQGAPPCPAELAGGALRLTGAAGSDLFLDPAGSDAPPDAGRLLGLPPAGDFSLSARVAVEFGQTFDAGVLLVYATGRHWAKLCFEYSPQQVPTAVTVVTREVSDDSNSFETDTDSLWLRITRTGPAWAFHASTDGTWWRLLRYFTLAEPDPARTAVGFLAQSPMGKGCAAAFDHIAFSSTIPADLRDGS
jgi:regulation of enolase protein 1 (concanavalin A-like superfamily)